MRQPFRDVVIPIAAVALAVMHAVWPKLAVDGVTVMLFLIALAPWLGRFIKSLELDRIGKIEFRDFANLEREARAKDVIKDAPAPETASTSTDQLQEIASSNPNLALAGMRIEIERKLAALAEVAGLKTDKRGSNLLKELEHADAIFNSEYYVYERFFSLLNQAVHGATVDVAAAEKAIQMGRNLLEGLSERIELIRRRKTK